MNERVLKGNVNPGRQALSKRENVSSMFSLLTENIRELIQTKRLNKNIELLLLSSL